MTQQFIINGKNIDSITSFYAEINNVFMQNEKWQIAESLDAFNDLLYGGFGAIDNNQFTQIIWKDIELSKTALGYNATKEYYHDKLRPGSPFNKKHFKEKLKELESGEGQTYFDIVIEILTAHLNINLIKD